jgi:thioredoxin-related protein
MELPVVVLGGLTLFLILAVLGSMRETVLLRGEVEALSQLITSPPPPSFIDRPVPDSLRKILESAEPAPSTSGERLVVFMTPGCAPCETIAEGLADAVNRGQVSTEDLLFVVWASPSEDTQRLVSQLPGHTVVDDGDLARVCEVRATPTIFIVSRGDFTVNDYNADGRLEWIMNRFAPETATPMAR